MPAAAARAYQPEAEDMLSARNFTRITGYILDQAGIRLPESKRTMLEGRLRRRLRATGVETFDDYCDFIFSNGNLAVEGPHLINAVTTNKTDFFREPKHFDYLCDELLPELHTQGLRRLRVWSAACSTGAEPYTLAMLLDDFIARRPGMAYGILATDIDTEVLETARRGVYATDLVIPVPDRLRRKYVMRASDPRRPEVRIAPELRSAVGFGRLNLMDSRYPIGDKMHLIFCRNVLIYFDRPTQEKVVARLADCLAPGGHLFLGHSETIAGFDVPLVQVANTVFRRA
jgi:chemotaxis protein methyltransferase CheR